MRKFLFLSLILGLCLYLLAGYKVRQDMFYFPNSQRISLVNMLQKEVLADEDYNTIYEQTGINKILIRQLEQQPDFETQILRLQNNYYKHYYVQKTAMSIFTSWDKVLDRKGNWTPVFELAPYENGDIFVTKSTYTANWRHGHAGIVVDEVHGKVLESLEPNTKSILQNASKWEYYPTFEMLRATKLPKETRNEIANYALTNLQGVPYNILAHKWQGKSPTSTHCSLIVWQAFMAFGINLDGNGGIWVSPQDFAKSPHLEVMQIFGINPKKL
ncbi:MAG: hypothetical protein ATN36_07980 [Epulopiscium sp. Nele67-Bin005]|nr:MAG: hypothetical protein ATN36_07980 [Epulopiscium sp. Nele67-Bin005]